MRFLVGSYADRGSDGIYLVEIVPQTGAMTVAAAAAAENPSFLTVSADAKRIYAVVESPRHRGAEGGGIAAFECNVEAGTITLIATQSVGGRSPCHVALSDDERWLITSNYGDGTHSVLPVAPDRSIGGLANVAVNIGQPGPGRTGGHAHSVTRDPLSGIWYACDLGLDRIIAYEQNSQTGRLSEIESAAVATSAGAGPRHIALGKRHPLLYAVCELDSTICVATRDRRRPEIMQTISTVPPDHAGPNSGADIHLSADGRFLYSSNRGHDSVSVFAVDPTSGLLAALGHTATGSCPRGFRIISPGIIVVANQRSNTIQAYATSDSGRPIPLGSPLAIPSPTCIAALPIAT